MQVHRITQSILVAALALSALVMTASPANGVAGFGDVTGGKFYAASVQWMVDNGLTTGTSPGCFSPDRTVSRAEVATFLHRYAGEPAGGSEPFVDVADGAYYRDAVAWLARAGITNGTSATTFAPDRSVTRGELATFLHRFAGSPPPLAGYGGGSFFADVQPGTFFTVPVQWMVGAGITTGTSPTTFEPYRHVTRAEAATFLYRLAGSPGVNVDPSGQCGAPVDDHIATAEARSLSLLNQLRSSVGVAPLVNLAVMNDFARDWSRTMSEGGFFAHSGGPYAENIVWHSNENLTPEQAAQRFHDMWVTSAGHYQNMTQAGYTKVGVGLWRDENGWHGTHVFAY